MITWKDYGPNALLFQFATELGDETFARGRSIVADLETHPPPGLVEFVPAFTTILLEFDPHEIPDPHRLAPELAEKFEKVISIQLPESPIKEIPVVYDGSDLKRVAEAHGLSAAEVCQLHAAVVYKVYMLGFAPGFPYLGDLHPKLHTPRLPSPRPLVRAGSVGIGGAHTGIYPVDGPAGWNIIGHTPLKIFDPIQPCFLLQQGDRVKFMPEG